MPDPITAFGILAVIFLVAALASGVIERAPISFPMIFLGLGFLLGEHGLGLVKIGTHDTTLQIIAVLNLSFVLFLDAINFRFNEIRRDWMIPVLTIGPGTLLAMLFITLVAAFWLHFPLIPALLTGAVLSSVDPVLLRDVVSDERLPRSIRDSLKMEAATSDIIVLPVVLILVAIALGQTGSTSTWLVLFFRLFILGPLSGAAIGVGAGYLMNLVRTHTSVSEEYRALYGIGVLLAAYYAGSSVGDSGFLAVFTAGFVIAALNYDVCDCFLHYGDVTVELAMLLAFTLFGVLLSSLIGAVVLLPTLIFALVILFFARPIAVWIVLRKAVLSERARLFIGWFGPRGLSSLLFALLLISDNVPNSGLILPVVGVVVIVSAILHGVTSAPLAALYGRAIARQTYPEERESKASGLFSPDATAVVRISPQELEDLLLSANPPVVLDVRTRSTYDRDEGQIPGSIRVPPDNVAEWAADKPKDRLIVTYCT